MNKNYEQAYQHINMARQVFYGVLTYDDFEYLCEKYELTPRNPRN